METKQYRIFLLLILLTQTTSALLVVNFLTFIKQLLILQFLCKQHYRDCRDENGNIKSITHLVSQNI